MNSPTMLVENGQGLVTKDAENIALVGGPGKLIIKQGNVVVLEAGGKISRIVNAGLVKLNRGEKLCNIFALTPMSNTVKIEGVLTKDGISLNISLGIVFQIEPAGEVHKRPESRNAPDGEALTRELDDGLFQVYEGTIRKAVRMSQSPSFDIRCIERMGRETYLGVLETHWQVVAGRPPEALLRDHIMTYTIDELFQLTDGAPFETDESRVSRRRIYEIEQAILEEIRPGRLTAFGVLVRGVDIGRIEFPPEVERAFIKGKLKLDYYMQENKRLRAQLTELHQREAKYLSFVGQARVDPSDLSRVEGKEFLLSSLRRERVIHLKNLRRLQETKAKYGIDVPVHILNGIEEAEEELKRVEDSIAELEK